MKVVPYETTSSQEKKKALSPFCDKNIFDGEWM